MKLSAHQPAPRLISALLAAIIFVIAPAIASAAQAEAPSAGCDTPAISTTQ